MLLDVKFLEQLQHFKIKNGLDEVSLYENYLYINGYKMIFITKNKRSKQFQIFCSGACHFEPIRTFGTFDLLFNTPDFNECICMFQSYIIRTFTTEKS